MGSNGPKGVAPTGKVVALPRLRKTSLGFTLLEFSHSVVLMVWVGSLAGFAMVVIPVLFSSLPSREMAARATLAILEQAAFWGCGAGAFLLLTTLLMHLLSLRDTRTTIVQMLLILAMTSSAIASQVTLTPRLLTLMRELAGGLDALPPGDPTRVALGHMLRSAIGILLVQILCGLGVLFFAVRRWYRYLPERKEGLPAHGRSLDPGLQ